MNDKHFKSMLGSIALLHALGLTGNQSPRSKEDDRITYTGDQLDAIKQEAFRAGVKIGKASDSGKLRNAMHLNDLADILIKSQGKKIDTLEEVVAAQRLRIAELVAACKGRLAISDQLSNENNRLAQDNEQLRADNAALRGAAKIDGVFTTVNVDAGEIAREVERRLVGYMPADCADGKRYGEFISVLGFPPDTIPSPGEHGYERRAYYVSREQLFGENTAVDPICHRASKFAEPETSEELVPVILTILRG